MPLANRRAILVILLAIGETSCSWFTYHQDIGIRVRNTSGAVLDDVVFGTENFGRLEPHSTSEYRKFVTAYSYGYLKLVTQHRTYEESPIDFVGETPLMPGRYTLRLTVLWSPGRELTVRQTMVTDW